jgi:hypothetical protein
MVNFGNGSWPQKNAVTPKSQSRSGVVRRIPRAGTGSIYERSD